MNPWSDFFSDPGSSSLGLSADSLDASTDTSNRRISRQWKEEALIAINEFQRHRFQQQSSEEREHNVINGHSIIPLHQAIHSIDSLEHLDLSTKSLSLDLCRVVRVFRQRPTLEDYGCRKHCRVRGLLPRTILEGWPDNGPLAPAYNYVVSMEVGYLKARSPTGTSSRIMIFFYDEYAHIVSSWLDTKPAGYGVYLEGILLRFQDIPAECIYPFPTTQWDEQDRLVPYCICIGGPSRSESERSAESDSFQLELSFPSSYKTLLVTKEYSQGDSATIRIENHKSKDSLESAWKEHQKRKDKVTKPIPLVEQNPYIHRRVVRIDPEARDEEPNPKRPRTEDQIPNATIEYASMGLLQEQLGRDSVNVWAVVLGFGSISCTTRGDYTLSVSLVDETETSPVTLVMFAKSKEWLPEFKQVGDVLRLHNAGLKQWDGNYQLQGLYRTQYVVARCGEDTETKSMIYTRPISNKATGQDPLNNSDRKRAHALWLWGQSYLKQHTTLREQNRVSLGEIRGMLEQEEARMVDMVAMVTALVPWARGNDPIAITPQGFLRIWDGTGEPTLGWWPNNSTPTPSNEPEDSVLERLASLMRKWNANRREEPARQVLSTPLTVPPNLCGTITSLIVWEKDQWDFIQNHVRLGSFVRVRNAKAKLSGTAIPSVAGLHLNTKSWLSPLPDESYDVLRVLAAHNERVERKEFNRATTMFPQVVGLASNNHDCQVVGSGLQTFVLAENSRECNSFQGRLRVLETTSPDFQGFLKVFCQRRGTSYSYRLVVSVQDLSTVLQVMVSNKAAEQLIGMSAEQAFHAPRQDFPFDTERIWMATLRSVVKQGQRYFVLTDIT